MQLKKQAGGVAVTKPVSARIRIVRMLRDHEPLSGAKRFSFEGATATES